MRTTASWGSRRAALVTRSSLEGGLEDIIRLMEDSMELSVVVCWRDFTVFGYNTDTAFLVHIF